MPSFIDRTKELRASGLSALDAAKQARSESNTGAVNNIPGTTSSSNTKKTVNPDGSITVSIAPPVDKPEVILGGAYETNPSPALPSIPIDFDTTGATNAYTGGSSANEGAPVGTTTSTPPSIGGAGNKKNTTNVGNVLDVVRKDATNTYVDNVATDAKQLTDAKKTQEDAANATIANLEAERLQKESAAIEEDRRQKAQALEDARIQKELDSKYRETEQASLDALRAKQAKAESDLAIANDVALQQSNVAFAKLGLSLSTAGITTAQQIYTSGIYSLSKLKADDAYQYAEMQEKVAKTEFDHTTAINKIIRESEDKSYTIRKNLNEEVYKIKNSIIKTTLDKQKSISDAIDAYQKARDENEANVIKKMTDAADSVKKQSESIYDVLKNKESYANTHIKYRVDSGTWATLPIAERNKLEQQAGVPIGSTLLANRAALGKLFDKQAEALTGLKGVTFSPAEYAKVIEEATYFQSLGNGPEESMNKALMAHLKNSPEFQAKQRENAKKGRSGTGTGTGAGTFGTSQLISYENPADKGTPNEGKVYTAQFTPGTKGSEGYVTQDGTKLPLGSLSKVTTPRPTEVNPFGDIK